MDEQEKYWQVIQRFVRDQFGMPGEVYDIVFLIGVREMGYGFQQLDQDTKTKVFNFASIYLMNFMSAEERRKIQVENKSLGDKTLGDNPSAEANEDWAGWKMTKDQDEKPLGEDKEKPAGGDLDLEEAIYKQAIINYFREKKII